MKNVALSLITISLIALMTNSGICHTINVGGLKRIQPDGTVFFGNEWGDEFSMQYETSDGYKYLFDYKTGYYVYALLGKDGGFIPSPWKVGIDDPQEHGISKKLELSPKKKAEIEAKRKIFNESFINLDKNIVSAKACKIASTITVDVILIEFTDVKGDTAKYTKTNFSNLFYSDNYTGTSIHPEGERVWGSIKAYWNTVSNGNLTINGQVLNSSNGIDKPNWVSVDRSKTACNSMNMLDVDTLFINTATRAGYNTTTSSTRWICYIYAGNGWDDGLHPHATTGKYMYIMHEKTDTNPSSYVRNTENATLSFSHIGQHCHELGHLLGVNHPNDTAHSWCIMCGGFYHGYRVGSCPAPPNPIFRKFKGWLTYENVDNTVYDKQILKGYNHAYKLDDKELGTNYWYVAEHRKPGEDYNRFVINDSLTTSDSDLGMLIWKHEVNYENGDKVYLINADNSYFYPGSGHTIVQQIAEMKGDVFPGTANKTKIGDFTSPKFNTSEQPWAHLYCRDIARSDDYTTMDIYINYYEGDAPWNLFSSKTLYNDTFYFGEIRIQNGKKLTIDNATIKMITSIPFFNYSTYDTKADIKIESGGELEIKNGSTIRSENSSPQKGDWGVIFVDSGGILDIQQGKRNTIQDAARPFQIESTNVSFPDDSLTTVKNCTYGLLINNCSPTDIENILFDDVCTVDNTGAVYIIGSSSDPVISNVTIEDSHHGLRIDVYGDVVLNDNDFKNTIQYNRIKMETGSDIDINGRENNIPDPATYYSIQTGGNSFDACDNYFGTFIKANAFSDTTKILSWENIANPYAGAGAPPKIVASPVVYNPFIPIEEYEMNGDILSAQRMYNDIIANSSNTGYKRRAIKSLIRMSEHYGYPFDDIRATIIDELKTSHSPYKESLEYLLCDLLVREGRYNEAISAFTSKVDEYGDTPMKVEMLARVAEIYGKKLGNKIKAKEYADRAAAINPGQGILLVAYQSAGIQYDPSDYPDKNNGDDVTLPKTHDNEPLPSSEENIKEFVNVSPNPSNVSTTITYSIKEPSHVKLNVYSINGQKVATLVDRTMGSGIHSVTFTSDNIASGVYFYRFESKGYKTTGKMLVVK